MILQARKWRMLLRLTALVITSVLLLVLAAPASYALQDDTPKLITRPDQLLSRDVSLVDTYVRASTIPDLSHMVVTRLGDTTYYWIPLAGYEGKLLVRTEGDSFLRAYYRAADLNLDTNPRPGNFYGKVTRLGGQANYKEVASSLAQQGVHVSDNNTMVIIQGEQPRTYRPVVPVVGVLATFWAVALVGLFRVLRGSGKRRARRSTIVATMAL